MNNDRIIFGQYYDTNSLIHKLDPRTKLLSLLILIISLFVIDNLYVLLGLTLFLLVLILLTNTPINKFFKSIKMMSYIMIFTFIVQLLVKQDGKLLVEYTFNLTVLNLGIIILLLTLWIMFGKYIKVFKITSFIALIIGVFALQYFVTITPSIKVYTVQIYEGGLTEASLIVIRIIDFLFISSLLTLTTKPIQINSGLESLLKPFRKFGLNVGAFAMIISVTLRFIPTLILEADKILKAQASRGVDLKDANLMKKASLMVSLVIPLFIITYKKAADLTYAMEARGYVEKKDRSSIYELKYKYYDYISIILVSLILVFSIISLFIL